MFSLHANKRPSARPSSTSRVVLFPFGQPFRPEERAHCEAMLVRAGGDPRRFIDAPASNLGRFIDYIKRIPRVADGTDPTMIVLTRTNPLALTVLRARKEIERALPGLERAPWLAYVSLVHDPFFLNSAQTLGCISGAMQTAPIWSPRGHGSFLILSPLVDDEHAVQSALERTHPSVPPPAHAKRRPNRSITSRTYRGFPAPVSNTQQRASA